MLNVLDIIPENLQEAVNAAVTWFNAHENASFEVTGIVDPPAAAGKGGDLRLVLCGGGVCRQETFQVTGSSDRPTVHWLGVDPVQDSVGIAELDPRLGCGWFLRPKAFTYQGDGVNPMQRFPLVLMRLLVSIGCWITAFMLLPSSWVSLALALYAPVMVLGIRKVYRTFAVETPE